MKSRIPDLLGLQGDRLVKALDDPALAPFYAGILAILKTEWAKRLWLIGAPFYTEYSTQIFKKFALPDFQAPIAFSDKGTILRQFDVRGDNFVLIPNQLKLSIAPNKEQIDFKLQLIRSSQSEFPPEPHGHLDLRVEPHYYMDDALAKVRALQPEAKINTPSFVWGYLHFYPIDQAIAKEKIEPSFMLWNGLSTGRILMRLSQQRVSFLKASLIQGGFLPFRVFAEALTIGVTPRVPVNVSLNPIDLLTKLRNELMNADGLLSRPAVVNFFLRSDPRQMGLEKIEPNGNFNKQNFAEAMADRVFIHFGDFVPSPNIDAGPYIKLENPDELAQSQSLLDQIRLEWSKFWMLDVPLPVARMYRLFLDMAEVKKQLEGQNVIEEITVPALLDGKVRVQVAVNVPSPRQGIDTLGVRILDSPDVDREVLLPESGDPDPVDLQFRPKRGNTYEYQYSTESKLANSSEIYRASAKSHTVTNFDSDFLYLAPQDFPFLFIPVKGTTNLLDGAIVKGTLKWSSGQVAFSLSSSQPTVSLTLPNDVDNGTIEIEVHSTTSIGVGVVKITLPAKATLLSPYNFREFGPQKVEIYCTPSQNNPVTYEFQREGDSNYQSLWFTSDLNKKTFSYSSKSFFEYRFRYRRQGQSSWSEYIDPFEPLTINP